MKDDLKNKLIEEVGATDFEKNLPEEIEGFRLKKIFDATGDKFNYFSYENPERHCTLTAYFHEETGEYKIRVKIGLTEFCLTDFFADKFPEFKVKLDSGIRGIIENLADFDNPKINSLVRDKKIPGWEYGKNFPATLEGFELFIKPTAPVEFTNGSFIIANYADFKIESDFVLYYNIYTDEFSGEAHINSVPDVSYTFDSKELPELEEKLKENLVEELRMIRRRSAETGV